MIVHAFLILGICAFGEATESSVRGSLRNRLLLSDNEVVLELNAGVDDGPYVIGNVWTSAFEDAIDVQNVGEYAELRFKSHRSGKSGFYYDIPDLEPDQEYEVVLGFAENWNGACNPSSRVFSVSCNGETIVSSLDVVVKSGSCYKALVESKTCTSGPDGDLMLEFTSTVQNPMLSFLDIKRSGPSTPTTTAPVPAPVVATESPVPVPVSLAPVVAPVVTPTVSTDPVLVLNAGVDDDIYLSGGVWSYQNAMDISASNNQYPATWFESHRSGFSGFSYSIPGFVPGKAYDISIGFAENYNPNCSPGKRIMSVDCNGESFVEFLDVFVEVGECFKALVLTNTHVADLNGNMVMTFSSSVENPMLSVLEIKAHDSMAPPVTPTTSSPTSVPDSTSSSAPVVAPVIAPTTASPIAPQPTDGCKVPQFVDGWIDGTQYPLNVAESQGAAIKDDFLVVSGFTNGYGQSTAKCYAIETGNPNAEWREMDDIPIPQGVTHGAFVVIGSKFYMCGGYLGGHPGPHMTECVVYDHDVAPGDGQWSFFSPLPDDEGRAGGGMVFDQGTNSLIFSAGAERPQAGNPNAVDYQHTWALDLSDINGEWVAKEDIPYLTNHMSYATGIDANGAERHFFLGGQMGENEHSGNHDENFEYIVATDTWIARQPMPFTRGHASSSTRAIGCGFIIAAGSTNEFGRTKDVSYYDIPSDTWTSIGELPNSINTPVCDIGTDDYLYCESGYANGKFSYKRKIVLV